MAIINSKYHISEIRHCLFPIEYPDTSDDGIAYIFHVENWTDRRAVFNDVNEIYFQLLYFSIIKININLFFIFLFL